MNFQTRDEIQACIRKCQDKQAAIMYIEKGWGSSLRPWIRGSTLILTPTWRLFSASTFDDLAYYIEQAIYSNAWKWGLTTPDNTDPLPTPWYNYPHLMDYTQWGCVWGSSQDIEEAIVEIDRMLEHGLHGAKECLKFLHQEIL